MDTDDPKKPKDPWLPRLANLYESKLPPSDRPKLEHTFFAGVVDLDTIYKVPCNEHGIIADPIWRRGIEPHTLLYDITTANVSLTEFKDAARSHFSYKIDVGLVSHNIGKPTIVKIVMTIKKDALKYANKGIIAGETYVYGFPSLGPAVDLAKVFFSKVPIPDRSNAVMNIQSHRLANGTNLTPAK
ncbi:hypothetical protein CLU79DRAFT_840436 [Phycomyces nitens]|nr:hypothetical protein CLU79DRAFT_841221 [Phycomyces nitens]KAI9007879.1 hypothetical protein CLU79DRAFT_840436 [Phycomyces nitens]